MNDKKVDDIITETIFNRFKHIIKNFHPTFSDDMLNLQTFLEMIEMSKFKPDNYFRMFKNLPKFAKKSIIKLSGKSESEFKKDFVKQLIRYKQDRKRLEESFENNMDDSLDI